MRQIKMCQNIDKEKGKQLLIGVLGVNIAFLVAGIQYEKITSVKYVNSQTGQEQFFRTTAGFIMVERFLNWLLGLIYQQFTVPKTQRVTLPKKSSFIIGLIIFVSSIAQTQSMYLVSYPLIIMAKSCSLLSVILVGIFCSRVRSKELKLGPKKIVIAVLVTLGILMFKLFDPATQMDDSRKTELVGLVLLLVSLFADGFLPDFQAEMKEKHKPRPIEMLITLNLWCGICSLAYLILTNKFIEFVQFSLYHPQFIKDLLLLTLTSFIGQLFIYKMIKEFKQHIVPFVVTTRKIITVGLSLVYFQHPTSLGQVLAIVLVFVVTVVEFLSEIMKKEGNQGEKVESSQKSDLLKNVDHKELIQVKSEDLNEFRLMTTSSEDSSQKETRKRRRRSEQSNK